MCPQHNRNSAYVEFSIVIFLSHFKYYVNFAKNSYSDEGGEKGHQLGDMYPELSP